MTVLAISGSTRTDSYNTRLAHLVAAACPGDAVQVVSDLAELPFFDQTIEAQGWPGPVQRLRDAVSGADLVVFVTPEYNGSHPGVLANAVDWLSRPYGQSALRGKDVVVLSTSPGSGGGHRAAAHLRSVLATTGAVVRPEGLSVSRASERLARPGEDGVLESLRVLLDRPDAAAA